MRVNNSIFLRRKNKVYVNTYLLADTSVNSSGVIASFIRNLEGLGYTLSSQLIEVLQGLNYSNLVNICTEILDVCKELKGADVVYNPMYPNFPKQVAESTDAELFINALVHYWSNGTLLPEYEKFKREPLLQNVNYEVIDLGTEEEYKQIFSNILVSKTSISQTDKEDLVFYLKDLMDMGNLDLLPDEIPFKENVALVGDLILKNNSSECYDEVYVVELLSKYFKTATDVLRLLTATSGGDVSLATNCKFRIFNRSERRIIINLLNRCGNVAEDMKKYQHRWIRIAERIHPFEFIEIKRTKAVLAFKMLIEEEKISTFGGRVMEAIKSQDIETAVRILKSRAGELARNLDYLLRIAKNSEENKLIINAFKEVAHDVSTNVLLQVKEHFKYRNSNQSDIRVFFPKGNLANQYSIPNTLPVIDETYCKAIVQVCELALTYNYGQKDFMGRVYLSDAFRNYLVPFSQRSASKSLKTVVRGSRLPFNSENSTIRAFIHWTNIGNGYGSRRVDIDLSAVILDENFRYMEHVSYTNLRSATYKAYHSGDITNGGDESGAGVAEFIDIDIDSITKYGARYVCFQVYSYTEQKFSSMQNALFGWMNRADINSGEIFEPSTVEQRINLTQDTVVEIPVVFDMINKEAVWMDIGYVGWSYGYRRNNLENNLTGVELTIKALCEMKKPNMYDLISLHINSRGLFETDRNNADIIFDIDTSKPTHIVKKVNEETKEEYEVVEDNNEVKIITPFDIDEIMALI